VAAPAGAAATVGLVSPEHVGPVPFAEAHPTLRGLGVDARGDVFVFDAASQEVFVFDRSNRLVHRFSVANSANGNGGAWHMAVGSSGDVFTLAYANGRVARYRAGGSLVGAWTVPNGGGPIAYDPRGSVLIQAGNDLLRYSPDGQLVANLGGAFRPSSVAVNSGGNRWLMIPQSPLVVEYDTSGSMTTWLQRGYRAVEPGSPRGDGQFGSGEPSAIAAARARGVWVGNDVSRSLTLFGSGGRVAAVCRIELVPDFLATGADGTLAASDGVHVVRFRQATRRRASCHPPIFTITRAQLIKRARPGRSALLRYQLSRGASVHIYILSITDTICPPPSPSPPGATPRPCEDWQEFGSGRVPGKAGINQIAVGRRVRGFHGPDGDRLPHGSYLIKLIADGPADAVSQTAFLRFTR
jgi:hypothetical protein